MQPAVCGAASAASSNSDACFQLSSDIPATSSEAGALGPSVECHAARSARSVEECASMLRLGSGDGALCSDSSFGTGRGRITNEPQALSAPAGGKAACAATESTLLQILQLRDEGELPLAHIAFPQDLFCIFARSIDEVCILLASGVILNSNLRPDCA